jgi:hypothetical protein
MDRKLIFLVNDYDDEVGKSGVRRLFSDEGEDINRVTPFSKSLRSKKSYANLSFRLRNMKARDLRPCLEIYSPSEAILYPEFGSMECSCSLNEASDVLGLVNLSSVPDEYAFSRFQDMEYMDLVVSYFSNGEFNGEVLNELGKYFDVEKVELRRLKSSYLGGD